MAPKKNGNQNIKVAVRCRPMNSMEKRMGSYAVVQPVPEKREIHVREKMGIVSQMKTFGFDYVFAPGAKQIDIYKAVVVPIIDEVLMGYNCTIFAYGQTGTGKTFTMEGERSTSAGSSWEDDPQAGVIPRSMSHIFDELRKQDVESSVRVSFIELYNEELFDLLGATTNLRMYEDPKRQGSLIIHGMEEIAVNSKDEIYHILERGAARRQTAATLMNATSSRSHSVFSVIIHTKDTTITGEELLKTGKLYLVDLAGSENIGRSGAVDKRAREAGNINQSLLTLGRVITSLVEHAPHVPYRESKLTRLLQDSLGGKTKTCIIATISPAASNLDETLSTLDYAHRAKNILNRPEINQKLTKKALLKEYTNEIETLKKDLLAAREKNGIFLAEENYNSMIEKMAQQEVIAKEMEERITALTEKKEKIEELFTKTDKQLEQTTETLNVTQNQLSVTKHDLKEKTVECEEQKYLVTEHVKTESELFSRAQTLLSTADESTTDVYGLHAKLDRKNKVESSNDSQLTQFKDQFQMSVLGMHKMTDTMLETMSKFHTDNTAQLNLLLEVLKTHSGSMLKSWFDMVDGVKNHVQQMRTAKDKEVVDTTKWIVETRTEMAEAQKEGVDHLSAINTEMMSGLQSQMNAFQLVQTMMMQLKQQLEQQKSDHQHRVKVLAEGLRNQLSTHSSLVTDHFNWQQGQIEQMQQTVEGSNTCNQDLEQYLTQAMDCIKMAQTKRESSSAFNEKLTQLVTAQKETNKFNNLQSELAATQDYVCQQTEEQLEHVTQHFESCIKTIDKVEIEVGGVQEKCTSLKSALTEHLKKTNEDWDECISVVNEKLDFCQTETNTSLNVFSNYTEKLELTATSAAESAQVLTEAADQKTSNQLNTILDLENSHSESISKHNESLKVELTTRQDEVETFIKEFAKDVPTGETPKPRQFTYPSELNQTEDHNGLLSLYRQNMKNLNLDQEEVTIEIVPVSKVCEKSPPLSEVGSDVDFNDAISDISMTSRISDISKTSKCKENQSHMPPPLSAKKGKRARTRTNSNGSRSRMPLRMNNQ